MSSIYHVWLRGAQHPDNRPGVVDGCNEAASQPSHVTSRRVNVIDESVCCVGWFGVEVGGERCEG